MQCVILAGGRGSRMQHLSGGLPKVLLPVGRHPFLHYQMAWLDQNGVDETLLCLGYQADKIADYLQGRPPLRMRVRCVAEPEPLRGTGGALHLALEQGTLQDSFLIAYGDSFLPIDFSAVWRYFHSRSEPVLMTVLRNEDRWGRSNACFDGSRVTFYDKRLTGTRPPDMRFIDYGLAAMRRTVVEEKIRSVPCDLADVYHEMSLRGLVAGYEVLERFHEIGSPEGLEEFSQYAGQRWSEERNAWNIPN